MLCASYYCLYSLFNKIRDKGRTVSVGMEGVGGEGEDLGCGQEGAGEGGRNDPNTVNK
jgi:hypothetical protein